MRARYKLPPTIHHLVENGAIPNPQRAVVTRIAGTTYSITILLAIEKGLLFPYLMIVFWKGKNKLVLLGEKTRGYTISHRYCGIF
jgi:hypothetical protein